MIEINVKVCSGTQTFNNTKVLVKLEDPVSVLKKKICEKYEELQEPLVEAIYRGCVMEDCNPISTYDVFRGATVYAFKKNPTKKPTTPKPLADSDLIKLEFVVRSFTVEPAFRNSIIKHIDPEEISHIISHVPELNEDPDAIALLLHSEFLVTLGDFEVVKRLAQCHPALASAILYLASIAYEEVLKAQIEKDIARTLASVNQPSQPRSSGAGTSTINNRNIHGYTMTPGEVSTSLQIMREMGLTNEALNLYTLRETNSLEAAVELILNGFGVGDTIRLDLI